MMNNKNEKKFKNVFDKTQRDRVKTWMSHEEMQFREYAFDCILNVLKSSSFIVEEVTGLDFINHDYSQESIAVKLTTSKSSYIVKLVRMPGVAECEKVFLDKWREFGVQTPEIYEIVSFKSPFQLSSLIMEYIDSPLAGNAFLSEELISKGIAYKMGVVLATMHQAKGKGYGRPILGHPLEGQHETFAEEIDQALLGGRIDLLKKEGYFSNALYNKTHQAIEIISSDNAIPALCHCDFRPYNIFLKTDKNIVVIDPNTRITHPSMCLALSLGRALVENEYNGLKEYNEILAGYESINQIDKNVLNSAMLLRGMMTMAVWVRKGRRVLTKRMYNLIDLVSEKIKI